VPDQANRWDPEIEIDERDVRRLVGAQFPQLRLRSLELLAEGWDNAVWVVNEDWAFRFPRVSGAVAFLRTEIAVLPGLGPLPLPIPVPVFIGKPDDGYPWPFTGASLIPGRELAASGLADDERVTAGRQLGAFLRALHDTDPAALGSSLPRRPERGDAARGLERDRVRLRQIDETGMWHVPERAHDLIEHAAALGSAPELVVGHGDLHVRHLLVDDRGRATGVIDWGEVAMLHPSIDLHIAYSGFTGISREALFATYGYVPEPWHVRARASALLYSVTLALYARQRDLSDLEQEAAHGIERSLSR